MAIGGFLELTYELHRKDVAIAEIDRSILLFVSHYRSPSLNGIAVVGGVSWSELLKNWVGRERPEVVPRLVEVVGFAYPSGHSLAASSLYLTLWILICRRFTRFQDRVILGLMTLFLIGSVALSRVYLGVQFPTDVLGGVCLGAAWAFFVTVVMSVQHRFLFIGVKDKRPS